MMCGVVDFDHPVARQLIDVLPEVVQVDSWSSSEVEWLRSTLGFIASEARQLRPGGAIAHIHRNPEHGWTVASLAQKAAMSRSAFSARFTELVGDAPMRYVTRWRMHVAHTWLREGDLSMMDVAHRLGYQSEAAFSRAFKRTMGVSPGAARRGALNEPRVAGTR